MDDLISRRAAIDAFDSAGELIVGGSANAQNVADYINKVIGKIKALPSVQPGPEEFEWCHDCAEYDQLQHCCHRWTKVIRNTVEELKEAQLERKTGKWIRNDNGTWSCDQCNSWIPDEQHYYARFCLHCGAKMEVAE